MKKQRIPEGGAIIDTNEMTMEDYSEVMGRMLFKEYLRFADNVINIIKPLFKSSILEIGPGPGWAGIRLIEKRNDLVLDGLEASKDMIRVAEKNAEKAGLSGQIRYLNGIGENMKNIDDKKYDLVISRDSLHHWDKPEKVFKEILRVLKPNGKVYIHDSRRDLNIMAKFIVEILGFFIAGNNVKYWKSSIAASYTPLEINEILTGLSINDWLVNGDFMDLTIIKA